MGTSREESIGLVLTVGDDEFERQYFELHLGFLRHVETIDCKLDSNVDGPKIVLGKVSIVHRSSKDPIPLIRNLPENVGSEKGVVVEP